MIVLFNYIRKLQASSFVRLKKTIIQCLFKDFQQRYISSKMLPYQTSEVFKYLCLIKFVYAYQVTTSLARTGISFQNNLHTLKLSIMFDMQY